MVQYRDYVINQIEHQETTPVPFSLPVDPEASAKLSQALPEWRKRIANYFEFVFRIDTDRRRIIDQKYLVDAFGGKWRHDCKPRHLEKPAIPEPTLENYRFPDWTVFTNDQTENKNKAIARCKETDSFRIVAIGLGLFEQSWRRRGFENALIDAVAHPVFYQELLQRFTELYLELIEYCSDIPADAIMFEDDWGYQQGVILGPETWRRMIKPFQKKIYAAVHAQGKYAISHCCGSVVDIMPDIIEIGLDVLESVQPEARGMNPYELKDTWGKDITFWGALGSQSMIPNGTPQQIRQEVKDLIAQMGKGGGYILGPAKPLQPDTPVENMVAVFDAFINQ